MQDDELTPYDGLLARLRALGQRPVDRALQSSHLTAMAGADRGARAGFGSVLAGRLKLGAAVLGGFLLGATGLTTVGAMGPLQPIAATAVEAVAPVDVPHGAKDKAAKASAKAAKARLEDGSIGTQRRWDDGCAAGEDGTFAGNRGLYLKQERAKGADALAAAKASDCGKPVGADTEADDVELESEIEAPEGDGTDGRQNGDAGKSDEDHGKPADPGAAGKAKADAAKDKSADPGTQGKGDGQANKPADPGRGGDGAGPPDTAGTSGIDPSDPETPATPEAPAPETDGS